MRSEKSRTWLSDFHFPQHHNSKASDLQHSVFFMVQLSHPYLITGKTIALTIWTFVSKVMSLLLNMLSKFVIAFLPKNNCLLISWLQSWFAITFGAQKDKICHCSNFFIFYLSWSNGTRSHDLSFWNVEFQASFFALLFHPIKSLLVSLHFLPLEWCHVNIWSCYFSQQSWFHLVIHLVWHFTWCTLHIS